MASKESAKPKYAGQAIVIPGEASETDEETDDDYSQRSASTSANFRKRSYFIFLHVDKKSFISAKASANAPNFQHSLANFMQKPKHDR